MIEAAREALQAKQRVKIPAMQRSFMNPGIADPLASGTWTSLSSPNVTYTTAGTASSSYNAAQLLNR